GLASRLGAVLRDPNKDLRKRSVLKEIMEPGRGKRGNAGQTRPPSANGADGKEPPEALLGAVDVLLERMATLDKALADRKAANGNGHASPSARIQAQRTK